MLAPLTAEDLAVVAAWSGHEPALVAADPRLHEMGRLLLADSLTGLYNRRYLIARLESAIAAGRALVVGILDMDGFKQVNDSLGHDGGDEVLRACARFLHSTLAEAVVARLGGDEFAVLFLDRTLDVVAVTLAELIRTMGEQLVMPALGRPLQFSAGIAAGPRDGADVSTLLRAADAALYWAKREGRSRVRLARDLGESVFLGDPRSAVLQAALTGRETMWARLMRRLEEAAAGRGGMISLEGPVGAGKSRLMAEAAAAAAAAGWSVVQVASGSTRPYRPFEDALAHLAGRTADRFEAARRLSPHRLVSALVQALLQAAEHPTPLCLCVDDLQEADNLTAMALCRLGPELVRRPFLILATMRTDSAAELSWIGLRGLGAAAGWLTREPVVGLDLSGTRNLVLALLGGSISNPAVRSLHEATGGNPLHITQVLKAWVSAGLLAPGPTGWTFRAEPPSPAPRDLRQALVWRVRQLDQEVREILGLAAVLGDRFERADLQNLAGATADELGSLLDLAIRAQMVVDEGAPTLRFAHPLLREAAYAELSPRTRRLAHRVAGNLLFESDGRPAAELARHFDAAGAVERAFHAHVQAGDQAAARFAQAAARQHFGRAWQLLPAAGASFEQWWTRLALRLAAAARANGDPQAAADVCRDALRHRASLPAADVLSLLLEQGEAARQAGLLPAAERIHAEALALAGPGTPDRELLMVRALGLRLRYNRAMPEESLAEALALAAEAGRLGERILQGSLYSTASAVLVQLGRTAESVTWNRRALALLPVGSGFDAIFARLRAGLLVRTVPAARTWLEEALEAAVAVGEAQMWARLLRLLGVLERAHGRWDVARRYYEQSLQVAGRQGTQIERDRTMYELGVLLAWQGRPAEGIALATAAADAAVARGDWMTAAAGRGRLAQCLIADGRPQEAVAALEPIERWLSPDNVVVRELRLIRVMALVHAGDLAAATAEAAPLRDKMAVLEGAAYHALVIGNLALAVGEPAEALSRLRKSRDVAGHPFVEQYWLAWARMDEARALAQLGQPAAARRARRRALQTFRRLGAAVQVPDRTPD